MSPRHTPHNSATVASVQLCAPINGHVCPPSPSQTTNTPTPLPGSERVYPLTHYVIVRSDLPRGVLASQIVHAAGESSPGSLPSGTYAVVLAVPDIKGLLQVKRDLDEAGIPHTLICEPDLPFNGAPMAIGLAPTQDRRTVRRILGRLPLLK